MIIGVDASNIRTGGGKKHLEKFINKSLRQFKEVRFVLVSNSIVNGSFKDQDRVECITNFLLNTNSLFSLISQLFYSSKYFQSKKCDIVFVPGGIFLSSFQPYVVMSQNMLPFDKEERNRFGFKMKIKILFIQLFQKYTFKRSQGVVFLTDYAKNTIIEQIGSVKSSVVIPHGIEQQLRNKYSHDNNNFQILYISDFLPYKHQYNVVKSVIDLIKEGLDINLTLIGNTDTYQHNLIIELLQKNKSIASKIKILGQLDFNKVKDYLNNSSLFLFASTCENLPFIVLEAISYGLPVITTDKMPMNQIVAGQNIFFDSLDIKSIKNIIKDNLNKEKLNKISELNYLNSKNYKWKTNVIQTINYLKSIAKSKSL